MTKAVICHFPVLEKQTSSEITGSIVLLSRFVRVRQSEVSVWSVKLCCINFPWKTQQIGGTCCFVLCAERVSVLLFRPGKKYTPYDAAVAKGNKEAAEYLLSRGGHSANAVPPAKNDRPISSKRKASKGQNSEDAKNQNLEKSQGKNSVKNHKEKQTSLEENGVESKDKDGAEGSQTTLQDDDTADQQPVVAVVVKHIERPASGKKNKQSSKNDPKCEEPDDQDRRSSPANTTTAEVNGEEHKTTEDGAQTATESKENIEDRNGNENGEDRETSADAEIQQTKDNSELEAVTVNRISSPNKGLDGAEQEDITTHTEGDERPADSVAERKEIPDNSHSTVTESTQTEREKHSSDSDSESESTSSTKPSSTETDQHQKSSNDRTSPSTQHHPVSSDSTKCAHEESKDASSLTKADSQKPQDQNLANKDKTARSKAAGSTKLSNKITHKTKPSSSLQKQPSKQKQQQLQTQKPASTKPRSRSASSSSGRSRSRSRSQSPSQSSGMGSTSSKRKTADNNKLSCEGDGLNLFSDMDNTDIEEEETGADTTNVKTPHDKDRDGQDDVHDDLVGRRKRPKSSRIIASIQESVKRYEQDRRSIRQLQQLRRAQIYSGHTRNLALFHSLLQTYGSRCGAPTWDQILQDQSKSREGTLPRSRTNSKLINHTGSGDNGTSHKDKLIIINNNSKNRVLEADSVKDSETGKSTSPSRRRGGAATSMGNNSKLPTDTQKRPTSDISPQNSPSPRRHHVHYELDLGDPVIYRQFQRQRTEDMQRLLIKAYRPAWPLDLLNIPKPPGSRTPSDAASSGHYGGSSLRASRASASTAKSTSRLTVSAAGQHATLTSPVSGQSTPSGVSHAQYRAVQRSFTVMTPHGSRRIRSDSDHQSSRSSARTARPRAATMHTDDKNYNYQQKTGAKHSNSNTTSSNNNNKKKRFTTSRAGTTHSNPR